MMAASKTSQSRKALPVLRKALKLAGPKKGRLSAKINFWMGEALRGARQCRKAVPFYRKAFAFPATDAKRKGDIKKALRKCGVKRP